MFDVAALLEDVEQKNFAIEARNDAEERLSAEKDRYINLEEQSLSKIAFLENRVTDEMREKGELSHHLDDLVCVVCIHLRFLN